VVVYRYREAKYLFLLALLVTVDRCQQHLYLAATNLQGFQK